MDGLCQPTHESYREDSTLHEVHDRTGWRKVVSVTANHNQVDFSANNLEIKKNLAKYSEITHQCQHEYRIGLYIDVSDDAQHNYVD